MHQLYIGTQRRLTPVSILPSALSQGAATLLQQQQIQLQASKASLHQHLSAAMSIQHKTSLQPFITSAAHAALCSSLTLICRLAQDARTAEQQHAYSSSIPLWKQALAALEEAAADCNAVQGEQLAQQEAVTHLHHVAAASNATQPDATPSSQSAEGDAQHSAAAFSG